MNETSATPEPSRSFFAAVAGATVFTWYAMPDVVRSRGVRTALKTGLLGLTAVGAAKAPSALGAGASERDASVTDLLEGRDSRVLLAASLAFLGAGTALTVVGEKWIFARGERLRADGRRWAHAPLAAVLAGLTAAAVLAEAGAAPAEPGRSLAEPSGEPSEPVGTPADPSVNLA